MFLQLNLHNDGMVQSHPGARRANPTPQNADKDFQFFSSPLFTVHKSWLHIYAKLTLRIYTITDEENEKLRFKRQVVMINDLCAHKHNLILGRGLNDVTLIYCDLPCFFFPNEVPYFSNTITETKHTFSSVSFMPIHMQITECYSE